MKYFYSLERAVITVISTLFNRILLHFSGVEVDRHFRTCGMLLVRNYSGKGKIKLGEGFNANSCYIANPVGGFNKTILYTMENGSIYIGNRVGISNSAICSNSSIVIEDDVCIGAGCRIYDTDFHSINAEERLEGNTNIKTAQVRIEKAFLGSAVTVLKGVTIGKEAVIAAGSTVTKDIPDREVWGGCPAKFIKKLPVKMTEV